MALEIFLRVGYYLKSRYSDFYESSIKGNTHEELRNILESGKSAVFKCLQDMRKFLNNLNIASGNKYITTFSVPSISIKCAKKSKINKFYHSEDAGWLDLCREYVCIHIPKNDLFLRFRYNAVKSFESKPNMIQLEVGMFVIQYQNMRI